MKTCPKCNALNNDVNVFCESCGNALPVENAAPQVPESEAPVQAAPQPQYQQYQPAPQPIYAMPPQFNEDMLPEEYKPVSVGKYIGYSILFSIPVVGFIMLLVTAFSGSTNKSLKNYARAMLVMMVIGTILGAIIGALIGILGLSAIDSGMMYY